MIAIVVVLLSAIPGGATFLLSLYRQFAMVEVVASLATRARLYFLSSSIGDVLEDQQEPSLPRLAAAAAIAGAVVIYFLVKRYAVSD